MSFSNWELEMFVREKSYATRSFLCAIHDVLVPVMMQCTPGNLVLGVN